MFPAILCGTLTKWVRRVGLVGPRVNKMWSMMAFMELVRWLVGEAKQKKKKSGVDSFTVSSQNPKCKLFSCHCCRARVVYQSKIWWHLRLMSVIVMTQMCLRWQYHYSCTIYILHNCLFIRQYYWNGKSFHKIIVTLMVYCLWSKLNHLD